jgi:anti-sigma factor RsiW
MNMPIENTPTGSRNDRHDDVLAWVSKELDGELAVRERVLLDDHLAGCPRCAQIRRELRGAHAFARSELEDRVLPPVGLVDRVVTHVLSPDHAAAPAEAAAAPVLLLRRLRRSAAVAAAALLVFGGIYVGRMPSEALAGFETRPSPRLEPDLERALSRGVGVTRGDERPLFVELLLPPARPK